MIEDPVGQQQPRILLHMPEEGSTSNNATVLYNAQARFAIFSRTAIKVRSTT